MQLATHGITQSGASFVPALDTLLSQGATLVRAYSVQRLTTAYTGDAGTITSDAAGNPAASIPFLVGGGMDVAAAEAIAASAGGTGGFWTLWNDQAGNYNAYSTIGFGPQFSSDIFAGGALGASSAGLSTYNLVGGAQNFAAMPFVWAVVRQGSTLSTNLWWGPAATSRWLTFGSNMTANFGATVTIASGAAPNTFYSLGYRSSSGANLDLQINNTTVKTQSSSTTGLVWTGSRIGANYTGTSSWWTNAGSLILEIIGFGADPRGLAGWSAFVANRHAFYGV